MFISCQQTKKQEATNPIELNQDSLKLDYSRTFTHQSFNDSLFNEGILSAERQVDNNNFSLYDIGSGMDSSSTPIEIFRDDLNFIILGEHQKNLSFRFCYNKAMLNFFYNQNSFNALDYVKDKYDSLYKLGLT